MWLGGLDSRLELIWGLLIPDKVVLIMLEFLCTLARVVALVSVLASVSGSGGDGRNVEIEAGNMQVQPAHPPPDLANDPSEGATHTTTRADRANERQVFHINTRNTELCCSSH